VGYSCDVFVLQEQISLAYQIAFDLYDSASQHFVSDIVQALKAGDVPTTTTKPSSVTSQPPVKAKADLPIPQTVPVASSGPSDAGTVSYSSSCWFLSNAIWSFLPGDLGGLKL